MRQNDATAHRTGSTNPNQKHHACTGEPWSSPRASRKRSAQLTGRGGGGRCGAQVGDDVEAGTAHGLPVVDGGVHVAEHREQLGRPEREELRVGEDVAEPGTVRVRAVILGHGGLTLRISGADTPGIR